MEQKVVKLINNFKEYINNGGSWVYIKGVNSDMSLIISETPINSFNLYKYIEDNFNISLNALTVNKFLEDNKVDEFNTEDAPTGFLEIDNQYALVNLEDGKAIVFDTIEQSIGRSSTKADIQLKGNNVSRVHCYIKLVNEEPAIRDNKSTNGVFINGFKISNEYTPLSVGSKVQIAENEFEVRSI